jgi:hypothetical protein
LFLKSPAKRPTATSLNWKRRIGKALLAPHVSYLGPLEVLLDKGIVKGLLTLQAAV